MKLPPSFFYKFFKDNTFFVVDKTIYNIKFEVNGGGVFSIGQKRFGIDEGLKLNKLEEIYFSNNDSELEEYGNKLLQKTLSDEREINKNYHELGEDLEFLELVWYGILKKKKGGKPNIKLLKIQREESYIIDDLFQYDCFVWKGKLYKIKDNKEGFFSAKINNKIYSGGESLGLNLEELEKKYLQKIEGKICNKLTKGQDSLLSKVKGLKEKKELIDLLKKREFFDEEEGIGFKKDSKGFFVTRKAASNAPKRINGKRTYVLLERSNGKYYRFEEALIGVKLTKNGNRIQWHDPIVIQPYIHPALPQKSFTSHQRICPGPADYNKLTKDKMIGDAVKDLLSEGQRLILHGYFLPNGQGAYFSLSNKHFQELEVKNYDKMEVTNEK